MKRELREKALLLRKSGNSYSYIKKELGVSKSTLSYWLRDLPLSRERINELRGRSEVRIEKYRQTMIQKRKERLNKIYKEEMKKWLPLSQKEVYIGGLFLYWGEGSKTTFDKVCISNTDPQIIRFASYWLTHALGVDKNKIRVALHLYTDMDVEKSKGYWSKLLDIDQNQFTKPYIKQSSSKEITHKGYGYGTCSLIVNDTKMKEKVLMGIHSVAEYFNHLT